MKRIRKNLFRRGRTFYYRRQEDGKDRWISLETADRARAVELLKQIDQARVMAKIGNGSRPRLTGRYVYLREVLERFEKAGFPRIDGGDRSERNKKVYAQYSANLKAAIGDTRLDEFNASTWNTYTRDRLANGAGEVALDTEMIALRSAYRYCAGFPNETGILEAPRFSWAKRLRRRSEVNHCRDRQPVDADELHRMARHYLSKPASQAVVGWFVLFQAMVGARLSEMLRLRLDAQNPVEPGYNDGEHLWLYRSKTHKGTAPFAIIHDDLRELLTAHRNWIDQAYPGSPWFFPCRRDPSQPIEGHAIKSAMAGISKEIGVHRSTHGLRSYYVNVLRSQGVSDSEIALRIGHKSGGQLIVETYGEVLPIKIGWRPKNNPPAWEDYLTALPIAEPSFA